MNLHHVRAERDDKRRLVIWTGDGDLLLCDCGSADLWSVKPGDAPVYGVARDLAGGEDKRLPPALLSRGVNDVGTCWECTMKSGGDNER